MRNTRDIRNDREDTSTRAFRKAAYRVFISARHGYLGKGNRRVCPSCVVLKKGSATHLPQEFTWVFGSTNSACAKVKTSPCVLPTDLVTRS